MLSVPDYKKNHLLPAALLRGFTSSNGRLCVYRVQEEPRRLMLQVMPLAARTRW